jgi:hypothetical protein
MKVEKPQFQEHGFIPTFWDSEGIKESWVRGRALFNRCKFPVVQIHAWASEDTDDLIGWMRQDVPNVRVLFGYGLDGVVNRVASQGVSQANGIRMVRELVRRGVEQGAVATVLDIEAAAKRDPGPDRTRVNSFLGALVSGPPSTPRTTTPSTTEPIPGTCSWVLSLRSRRRWHRCTPLRRGR